MKLNVVEMVGATSSGGSLVRALGLGTGTNLPPVADAWDRAMSGVCDFVCVGGLSVCGSVRALKGQESCAIANITARCADKSKQTG